MSAIAKLAREQGLEMVDAVEPLRIEVSKGDVRGAKRKDPSNCAFSRACRRTYGVDAAFFFRSRAWLQSNGKLIRFEMPASMQKEIVAFDRSKHMEPGVYQLKPPAPSSTRAYAKAYDKRRRDKGHHSEEPSGISRRFVHKSANVRGLEITPNGR